MVRALDSRRVVKFGLLTAVAVGGSILFGAATGSAALLTLSTGSAWIVFGLLLYFMTRKPILDLADACLTTMAYGEAVLVSGAALTWMSIRFGIVDPSPMWLYLAIVAAADAVMATALTIRLSEMRVPRQVSLGLWIVGLNGSWFIFLWLYTYLLY